MYVCVCLRELRVAGLGVQEHGDEAEELLEDEREVGQVHLRLGDIYLLSIYYLYLSLSLSISLYLSIYIIYIIY